MAENWAPTGLDVSTPNVARMYDYYLGGKDNYAADRQVAEQVLSHYPQLRAVTRENRAFLIRAVRYLAGEVGVRQFIDIGTGLPTMENVHQVAHAVDPQARIVYVDYDGVVCAHARALLATTDQVTVVQADVRDPEAILTDPETLKLIDFSRPVAVLLVALLHFISDDEDPYEIVRRLRDRMAPGSYLVISHAGGELPGGAREAAATYKRATAQMWLRDKADVLRFFDGFDLVDPGLVPVLTWRNPTPPPPEVAAQVGAAGVVGVGMKQ